MKKKEKDVVTAVCGCSKQTKGIDAFCTKCEESIWLSDSTMEALKENFPKVDFAKEPPVLLCIPCGLKKMSEEDTELMEMTETQKKELKDGLGLK